MHFLTHWVRNWRFLYSSSFGFKLLLFGSMYIVATFFLIFRFNHSCSFREYMKQRDPSWQPTESLPFMKPTLHVYQTKLMAMMSPKGDPLCFHIVRTSTLMILMTHGEDDNHMTCTCTNTVTLPKQSPPTPLFLAIHYYSLSNPQWKQPNNDIY